MFTGKHRRSLAAAFGTLFLQSCGCSGSGCVSGLFVRLSAIPTAGPVRIELFVGGVLQPPPSYDPCLENLKCGAVRFDTEARDGVSIHVTTGNCVRFINYDRITYSYSDPSYTCGEKCKGQATITADIP